jgi:hypothetical protein
MEKQTAQNWYWWLWLSPLLTIPTLLFLFLLLWFMDLEDLGALIAVLGSALWHLVLLIPALNKEHPFVHWHGRQALLLAGVRTAVPLVLGLALFDALIEAMLVAIPVLIVIWFSGTLWGQRQAARGDCSLMRWFDQEGLLSTPRAANVKTQAGEQGAEALVKIIRFSCDLEERRSALAELESRGMVEDL